MPSVEAGQDMAAQAELAKEQAILEAMLKDAEKVLAPEVMEADVVNVGEPAIKGFSRREIGGGRVLEKPKEKCEDRKINDPENGLFVVADGVSTGHGAIASEITSRVMAARLGSDLNQELGRLIESGNADEEAINEYVGTRMAAAIREANGAVMAVQRLNSEYNGAATTLSAAKLVELPDGKQRLYYANIGDSRIYLQKGNELVQLTQDDSLFQARLDAGQINMDAEQIDRIDQYLDLDKLSPEERRHAKSRAMITEAVGQNSLRVSDPFYEKDNPASTIKFIDVEPGTRIVITSDGIHDNSLRSDMARRLAEAPDARSAERALQQDAVAIQRNKDHGRSKPDDTSAVVFEVPEREEAAPAREYGPEHVAAWKGMLADTEISIQLVTQELGALEKSGQVVEAAEKRIELNKMEQDKANLEYWIAQAEMDRMSDRLNELKKARPRAEVGDQIVAKVKRSTGAIESIPFTVTGYDKQGKVVIRGETDKSVVTQALSETEFIAALRDQLRDGVDEQEEARDAHKAAYEAAGKKDGELKAALSEAKASMEARAARARAVELSRPAAPARKEVTFINSDAYYGNRTPQAEPQREGTPLQEVIPADDIEAYTEQVATLGPERDDAAETVAVLERAMSVLKQADERRMAGQPLDPALEPERRRILARSAAFGGVSGMERSLTESRAKLQELNDKLIEPEYWLAKAELDAAEKALDNEQNALGGFSREAMNRVNDAQARFDDLAKKRKERGDRKAKEFKAKMANPQK